MNYNWGYVKKTTLWDYDELLKKLNAVLAYPVLRTAYNHTLPQAADFARRLFLDRDIAAGEFPADMLAAFKELRAAGVKDWADLLEKVGTQAACAAFIEQHRLKFEEVIQVLNYLLRWGFPFRTATRELLDPASPAEMTGYAAVKQHGLMCSFDLLERGRTRAARRALAGQVGLPLDFVTTLVHRADIARLPFVRRKTLLPVCGAGYDTLARIAAAEAARMEADLDAYVRRTQGKRWDNFKSVIIVRGLVAGARALPRILTG